MTFTSRLVPAVLAAAALLPLAGCGEKPQTEVGRRSDQKAWVGTRDGYQLAGWRAGDEASWDQQMRARALNQNEYLRTMPSPTAAATSTPRAPASAAASAAESGAAAAAAAAAVATAMASGPVATAPTPAGSAPMAGSTPMSSPPASR